MHQCQGAVLLMCADKCVLVLLLSRLSGQVEQHGLFKLLWRVSMTQPNDMSRTVVSVKLVDVVASSRRMRCNFCSKPAGCPTCVEPACKSWNDDSVLVDRHLGAIHVINIERYSVFRPAIKSQVSQLLICWYSEGLG